MEFKRFSKDKQEQIRQFAERRSSTTHIVEGFTDAIYSSRNLAALAHNPLFLVLLWQLYEYRGSLPSNRASLYADCVDFLLSSWERSKALSRNRLTVDEKQILLEGLSFRLLLDDRNTRMAERISQWLGGDKKVLVIVGSAHLAGKDSILSRLSDADYTIRQVPKANKRATPASNTKTGANS